MPDLARLAGAVLLGGLAGPTLRDDERADLAAGRIAGVVLYRHTATAPVRNLDGTLAQLAALCAEVRAAAPRALIALDHEGGRVQRVRDAATDLPSARNAGGRGKGRAADTRAAWARAGAALRAAGVSLVLGPVADVCDGDDGDAIGDRAFGATPAVVALHARSAVQGLADAGVACCTKHWPGIGGGACDPHFGRSTRARRADHAAVFAGLGAPATMLAHVTLTDLDATRPATLSPACYAAARAQVGAGAVLCTDDLNMTAIAGFYPVPDAAAQAIAAGADLVLVGASPLQHQAVHAALVARAAADPVFAGRLADAGARVAALHT